VTPRSRATTLTLCASTLALAACLVRSTPPDVPAVLTGPTAESRAELVRVVSHALNGVPVTLADDALTVESSLIVERTRRRDPQGRPLDGRETGRPERFRLVRSGSRCVLIHEGTERRFTLASADCSARGTT
jgi:hypothetical protein